MMELYNEGTDLIFLAQLWTASLPLFWASVFFLLLNVLGRMLVLWRQSKDVDKTKRWAFARAALLYMIEPNAGMRKMKATLNEKEPGGKV